MIPVYSIPNFFDRLDKELVGFEDQLRLIAIVFCRPELTLTREEIIPHLTYYHSRSADYVDFFFPGFLNKHDYPEGKCQSTEVHGPKGEAWIFDHENFDECRKQLESSCTWRYRGGSDLILANAGYDRERNESFIDIGSAICLSLESIKKIEGLPQISMLFERIFSFSESMNGGNPTNRLSDQFAKEFGKNALVEWLFSCLPSAIRGDAHALRSYAIQDLSGNRWHCSPTIEGDGMVISPSYTISGPPTHKRLYRSSIGL